MCEYNISFKINGESLNFINKENNREINAGNSPSYINYDISRGNQNKRVIKNIGNNNNNANFENIPILEKILKGNNNFIYNHFIEMPFDKEQKEGDKGIVDKELAKKEDLERREKVLKRKEEEFSAKKKKWEKELEAIKAKELEKQKKWEKDFKEMKKKETARLKEWENSLLKKERELLLKSQGNGHLVGENNNP